MRNQLLLLMLVFALVVPSTARAQSLADVAKAEAVRRKRQTAPSKMYTNETLSGTPSDVAGDAGTAKPATAAAGTANPAAKTEPPDEKNTEAYWKSRVTALQQSLARHKVLTEAMQSRINALHAEGLSADDPGRQAAIQTSLTTAVGELQRLKQETEKQNKDLAAIHEEARRANIPPGWLR